MAVERNGSEFHIVGIGASAGGLDALERFFDALPLDTGMAFVVIQHLSPAFKSMMDQLLRRHTQLPIQLVEDGMQVESNNIYLIPPKKEMIISDGRLLLSEREQNQELSLPIDTFFRSLARDCGERAVGIVLSGGGSDGSRGIRDIHEAGGLVLVQDEASAQFDGMPRTARDAGVARWVLSPAEMPRVLLDYAVGQVGKQPPTGMADDPDGIAAVYHMLQEEYSIDFTHYKPSTVTRRIERRLSLARSQNIQEYVRHLRADKLELDVLYRDLLIGVTRFFRDGGAFAVMEKKVLPDLFERVPRDRPVRIWVAGCATGEEVYSLAIALSDLQLERGARPVKIFATDVHRGSLERAARGVYDEEALANVSPERLTRYFTRVGSTYQVVPDLRQMVVFAPHNVIRDAPFTRVDLVTCRNLLIYLQPSAQQKVLSLLHFALNRGGVMFLGPSENPGTVIRDLETVDKHWKIYRKLTDARAAQGTRPNVPTVEARLDLAAPQAPASRYSLSQLLATYDALLDDVMPPALLVSDRGELIHTFAGASRFLRFRDGRPGLEVFDCVDAQLKMVLVGGLKRALAERMPIVFKGVSLTVEGNTASYKVTLRAVQRRSIGTPHVLITLEPLQVEAPVQPGETEIQMDQVSREQLALLEVELSHAKQNLQAAVEELETSNEELQASNEELQASNEELQSTNEELQSVNEELYTVNTEYQRKIGELTELANDMDNLLSSTDVGTIFLDNELRIRKFTPQIAGSFSLVAHDVGRSIETFAHKMDHPELVDELKHVLRSGERVERQLRGVTGKALFLRILPYRAKGAIGGVVLTMIDMTGLRAAEDALFHERYLLNSLLTGVPDAIYFKDARGRFIRMNHAMAERLGLPSPEEAVGKTVFELKDQERARMLHHEDEAVLRSGQPQLYKEEKRTAPDGSEAWDLVSRLPLKDTEERAVGVISIFRSITEQKRADYKIQEAVRRRDQFLAMLSHELRNPLGAIATASALLKSDLEAASVSAAQPKLLDVVDRQTRQMGHLLDDLLEVSRVTENKVELRKRVVDLRDVLHETADAVGPVMKARRLAFTVDAPTEPLYVLGDPTRLQQIQVNLLSNAAKYTEPGGHVALRVQRDGEEAVVCVRDDGVGIAREMLDSVFELFVQSARTLDRSAGGLGVGLTLARSLVGMHGGKISVQSEGEGKGSEFTVRLPLADGPASERPPPRSVNQRAGKARVLIVEDNDDSRELLCQLLERNGFDCRSANTGTSALDVLRGFAPDVAILDVGLPEMDGFELARRIRLDPQHAQTILIAVTGYGRASDHEASRAVGFDGHLVKPVNTSHLLSLLSSIQNGDGYPDSVRRADLLHGDPRREGQGGKGSGSGAGNGSSSQHADPLLAEGPLSDR
ncbi:MAG: Family ership [Pseudomonadota bacterium]